MSSKFLRNLANGGSKRGPFDQRLRPSTPRSGDVSLCPGIWISKFPASAYASPSNRSIERSRFNSGSNNMTAMRQRLQLRRTPNAMSGTSRQPSYPPRLPIAPGDAEARRQLALPCGELVVRLANRRSSSGDQVSVKSSAAVLRMDRSGRNPKRAPALGAP